jgi:AcrR family transcriptional regulator
VTAQGSRAGSGNVAGSGRDRPTAAQPRTGGRRRTGRRAGDSGTREAIIDAARGQFAERGYDRATIRGIAAAAGVDPALVHHYYGSKERLFTTAMQLPVVPGEAIAAVLADSEHQAGESFGEHLVRSALEIWDVAEVNAALQAMLRSALTSDRAATMLREFVTETILGPVSRAAQGRDQQDVALRASLVGTHMIGLAVARYVLRFGPVADAHPAELAAAVGPAIDRYLTGSLAQGRIGSRTARFP